MPRTSSLYDNIRQANSQYIPKFVGSNYEELSVAKKTLEDRYRANKDYSDKIAMVLAQEQYNKADQHIKDGLAQSIYGQIDKISKSDENFENSSAAVSQLAKDFFTNQDRIAALDNYKRVEEAKALRVKMGADALNFGDDIDNFSTIDPETGERRRFELGLEQKLDYDKQREQFYNQIETDIKEGKLKKADLAGIYGFVQQGYSESNEAKISGYLKDALTRYKTTSEYAQEKRKLTQLDGYSEEEADKLIEDNLTAVGKERLLNRNRLNYSQDPFAIYAAKKSLEDNAQSTVDRGRTQYFTNPALPKNPLEGAKFNPDGTVTREIGIMEKIGSFNPAAGLGFTPTGVEIGRGTKEEAPGSENITSEAIDAINKIKETNQSSLVVLEQQGGKEFADNYDLSNLTPKQITDLHNKAYDNMKAISASTIKPSTDVLASLSTYIKNDLQNRAVYVLDNESKPTQGGTFQTAMKDLGLSGEDQIKAKKDLEVTAVVPFNPYNESLAGGYLATIDTPDGVRTILVEADQGQQTLFQRGNRLSQAKMTGQRVTLSPNESLDGFGYVATPLLNPKTGEYDVFVVKYDKDNNVLPFVDNQGKKSTFINLDDMIEMDLDRLQSSGLLRSKLGKTKPTSVDNPIDE